MSATQPRVSGQVVGIAIHTTLRAQDGDTPLLFEVELKGPHWRLELTADRTQVQGLLVGDWAELGFDGERITIIGPAS